MQEPTEGDSGADESPTTLTGGVKGKPISLGRKDSGNFSEDSHTMMRLSDFPASNSFSQIHPRLSPIDGLMTEYSYNFLLIRRYWGYDEALIVLLSIFGYVLGAWDLGIGELSSGGDYNRSGIFGEESGFLHIAELALILAFLSVICWGAFFSLLWLRYPIMRENMVYLVIGILFIQGGYLKAHSESPSFPTGLGMWDWLPVIVVNLVMLFLSVFVVNRAVIETRDVHVQERHSHPDPRVFDRAWHDHSLRAWSSTIGVWIVLLNMSSWFGSHSISQSPGELDFSYLMVFIYVITGIFSIVFFLNIIWFPQFMLGGAEERIQTSRAREVAGESTPQHRDEQGKCPVCNQRTAATRNAFGLVQAPCREQGCIGKGQPGSKCDKCESRIPTRVVCPNCGSSTPIGSHFGRVEVW